MDRRLIEAGFPCHQVGAETQRERGASSALPPLYFLHVWWARRPLTPSRAAVAGSLLPADTDVESFVKELGIEKRVVTLGGQHWVIVGKLLGRLEKTADGERLQVDPVVLRAFDSEQERREESLQQIAQLKAQSPELAKHPVLLRWEAESRPLSQIHAGQWLTVERIMADPAHVNERIEFAKMPDVKAILGKEIKWDAEDLYGYARAYQNDHAPKPSGLTVLDPTSGGGSIPFEALRLGHNVIANELNPVATTILYATLDYPARFGISLYDDIEHWGNILLEKVESQMAPFYPFSPLPKYEQDRLRKHLEHCPELFDQFNQPEYDQNGLLYCREVTCPSCQAKTPLLNTCWLSKEAADPWGVKIITQGQGASASYRFETYQVQKGGKGPSGEDPEFSTVERGVGQCVHCKQAVDGDEIKAQARGESQYGQWRDQLYSIVSIRHQPKLDAKGRAQFFSSGDRAGQLKTEKIKFFRAPNEADFNAIEKAKIALEKSWGRFDDQGLIPTERFPEGNDMRPALYGMDQWFKMFTERQLLGHLHMMEALRKVKDEIIKSHGFERGRALVTYLQYAIEKIVDYNSRQTRWIAQRGTVSGTFGRHDFSLKWTFGEMAYAGPFSGARWGLSQVLDAYSRLCDMTLPLHRSSSGALPLKIINGTAANISPVADCSVDLVCMDPPYYDNVQYAELSDFYYVWTKRSLKDLYPEIGWPRLTNKRDEAVASQLRDGSASSAKDEYERLMREIFSESRRVLKDDGVMTIMFTHKSQDAWETLTKSIIESGWNITASFPVESEFSYSTHQLNLAAAASSIFITCRKRKGDQPFQAVWTGLGGMGVQSKIRESVESALEEFSVLKLNPVDKMIACYGRALQVLSESWPVMDGNEEVNPIRAMNEASRVVAEHQIRDITEGRITVDDLDTETAMALTVYGIWGHNDVAYSEALNLSKSLNFRLESRIAGYGGEDRLVAYNTEESGAKRKGASVEAVGYAAPLLKKGSKLRLAKPEERDKRRIAKPQSDWDVLHGLIMCYRSGDIPVARAYLDQHREGRENTVLDLLEVWAAEAETPELRNEARAILFGLKTH
ncbi:TPA: DUF1156 domain-containing protein [Pseudomonas aeruginosa]|nr:DUF1156 domain-containing protein [Pseudomonas aeruginosa]